MFNSSQRNFAQRATTTTDNTPSVTISVNLDLKDTYITNKVSDYSSKVYEPKGSGFVTVSDVDYEPTNPGKYVLPLSDSDTSSVLQEIRTKQNLNDSVVLNVQSNPISSKTIEILPTKNHYLQGFSFTDGGLAEALVKAFENKDRTGGYLVLQATKDGSPYLLTLTNDGEVVPFVRLQSTLPPEVIPSTPETVGPEALILTRDQGQNLLNTYKCCCDSDSDEGCDLEGWDDTGVPEIFEGGIYPPGEWSPQNPCGYLGTSKDCICQFTIEIVNATTGQVIYEGATTGSQYDQRGYSSNPNNADAPPGYRPCGYDPNSENPELGWMSNVTVATCTHSRTQENCYTIDPNPLLRLLGAGGIRIPPQTICVTITTYCSKILVNYYGAGCGCAACPCSKPFCEGDPNCPTSETDAGTQTLSSI